MQSQAATKRGIVTSTEWRRILLILPFGFYAVWMEWVFFSNFSLDELPWIVTIIVLALIVRGRFLKQPELTAVRWVAVGTLCWSIWRFAGWIFAARSSLV